MSKIKLLPCPFCGCKDIKIDDISTPDEKYYMITCQNDNCAAAVCYGDASETKSGAARKWNERST